jgi:hypothetical protein
MGEVCELVKVCRHRWANPSFLHDWFLLPLARSSSYEAPYR